MKIKSLARSVLPAPAWQSLMRGRRHWRWRLAQLRGRVMTGECLVSGLVQLGLREGDVVLVHSSLTRLGHVEGGPDTVIDSVLKVVGASGTVLMPAYPVVGDWMTYVRSDRLFDPRTSPSAFGKITDMFWRRPGVVRSLHPTHSVAACGPQAEYLVKDHEKSSTPAGPTSPFRKLIELDGRILHLGSPFFTTSSFHVVEDVVCPFPRQVYMEEAVRMRYLDHEGVERAMMVRIHNPALVPERIDNDKALEMEIYNHCRQAGVVRTGKIGQATVHLLEARPLEQLMEELARRDITIWSWPPPGRNRTRQEHGHVI